MDEDLIETKLSSITVYDGKLLHVKCDLVRLPNGREASREWIQHPGAAAVLPMLSDGRVVLVRQYRYPVQSVTLEIPAGKLDGLEDPMECAKRELAEETGYRATEWVSLGAVATSPGFCNEVIHLYLAKGLTMGETNWDPDEYVELEYYTVDELLEAIKNEDIKDGKSLAGLMLAMPYLK